MEREFKVAYTGFCDFAHFNWSDPSRHTPFIRRSIGLHCPRIGPGTGSDPIRLFSPIGNGVQTTLEFNLLSLRRFGRHHYRRWIALDHAKPQLQHHATHGFAMITAIRTYSLLTKPGIILGNVLTAAAGFALASKGSLNFQLFAATLSGLSLIVASGCVFNNYIDRVADEKMHRTRNRALAKGLIAPRSALLFAGCLVLLGALFLALFTNLLTVGIALTGFVVYVFLYSFIKYRSTTATLIGSIAGAVPPVVGYCAVSQRLDLSCALLFVTIALWQMPHFYAIAIYRLEEYAAASIPVLPLKKGIKATKIQMLLYTLAFIAAASLLCGYPGAILGCAWLGFCIAGFKSKEDKVWARQMFLCSLIVVLGLCSAIALN